MNNTTRPELDSSAAAFTSQRPASRWVARALTLPFALAIGLLSWGCEPGSSEPESEEDVEADELGEPEPELDEPDAEQQIQRPCIPMKIPVCGPSTTLSCEGTGSCRRCYCSEL